MLALHNRLRALDDPVEIQREAARAVGDRLEATWTHYAQFDDDLAFATVDYSHVRGDVPTVVGRYALDPYRPIVTALQSGQTFAERDLSSGPYADAGEPPEDVTVRVCGFAAVPIVKSGRLIAALIVSYRVPHDWTEEETGLIEATAERTWSAVVRARVEQALDIGMSGMDGYETCRRIRREIGAGVRIVALTGWGHERD
jgi:GAF domain-containing protein